MKTTQNIYTRSNPYCQDKLSVAGYEHQKLCPHKCKDNHMSTQVHTGKDDHINSSHGRSRYSHV